MPSQGPDKIPYPSTEENKDLLKEFLLAYYASTLLPKMDVPPLRLMVDKDATPYACHKAIPVTIHWKVKINEGIDRDILASHDHTMKS